ncbi:MAG: CRTAC1 family protein [Deltaproteobacteria bacterium]|nr:CRTAC1 family protein [Deltaproteobacteria bacterium]
MSAVAHIKEYKTGRFFSDDYRGDMSWNGYENNVLLRNDGCDADGVPQFTDVAMALGADDDRDARGMAIADFDRDGDLDIVINHNPGDNDDLDRRGPTLLRNDLGNSRPWFTVDLVGTESNRDGVGAMVTLEATGHRQLRLATAGSGYASQSSSRLHFGLDAAEVVESLTVRWPSGKEEIYGPFEGRRSVRLTEGQGAELIDLTPSQRPLGGGVELEAEDRVGNA